MSALGTGAQLAVIVAALPAATGAVVWTKRQLDHRRERQAARETRNWSGYIMAPGISTWYVSVVENPETRWTERVVVDVVNRDGTPNPEMAHVMRLHAKSDGMLSRSPTPAQCDFLLDLEKDRYNRGDGYPIP